MTVSAASLSHKRDNILTDASNYISPLYSIL